MPTFYAPFMHPARSLLLLGLFLAVCSLAAQTGPVRLTAPATAKLLAEDARGGGNRFAAPLGVDVAPVDFAEVDGGGVGWSREFVVPGAGGLALLLSELRLPQGARLELGGAAGAVKRIYGPEDRSRAGRLHTDFVEGERLTLTYRGPRPDSLPFRITRVDHVYRPEALGKGFGDSDDCQRNDACLDEAGWDGVRSGLARIKLVVAEGVGYCSGNLVNNTARDGRPLLLTGFHCVDGFTPLYDLWEFAFGYAAPTCAQPATEPSPEQLYRGAAPLAGRRESDFLLLDIADPTFASEDHYFAGWDRSDGPVGGPVTHFHHPRGDIRKYGRSGPEGMTIITNRITWNSEVVTPRDHHFRFHYAAGSFEPGSSGSAFFDTARRLRGQLNGGNPRCPGQSEAFVGRLFMSWDGGERPTERLADWLDPAATGALTLDGEDLLTRRFVSGTARDRDGRPVAGVELVFRFAPGDSTVLTTGPDGSYRTERPPTIPGFFVSGRYDTDGPEENGVDVFDIIAIRRHILRLDTLNPRQLLAADVNNSASVRTSDIIGIVRVILGQGDLTARGNWLVLPDDLPLDPLVPDVFRPLGLALNSPLNPDVRLDFLVLKNGDATGDALLRAP